MPDPSTPNRERLLRLIDGGPEALKELSREEPAKPDAKKTPDATLSRWKSKLGPFSNRRLIRLAPAAVILAALLAGLYYGVGTLRTLKPAAPAAVPQAAAGAVSVTPEDSGAGLRLVGVDSSGPPVALLEDVKTGKTYFAKVGEKVKDARVKEILKNKVLVTVRGKTVELS